MIPWKECALAVDLGGTSGKCALVTPEGEVLEKSSFPTGPFATRETLLQSLFQAVDRAALRGVSRLGVATLGIVDPAGGRILGGVENLPCLAGLSLPDAVRERSPGFDVRVQNDVSAAAMGEMRFGAARGCRHFFCVAVGTGIGGALVVDGRVVSGAHGRAGEVGYWDYQGEGSYLETRVSAVGLVKEAAQALNMPELDGVAFFRRVGEGDPVCLAILKRQMAHLAGCLANLILAADVERIVVGGGITGAADAWLPLLESLVEQRLPPAFRHQCPLVAAMKGNDAALLGAVAGFFDK